MCLLELGLPAAVRADSLSGITSVGGSREGNDRDVHFIRQGILPRFGDYELQSEIARGGMGIVYRAHQRSLNRTVAVKMILAGQLATPESVQGFRLEAEAAARLHHPGIVQIYEIGECETQHFFSMELIEGDSLAACIADFQLHPHASPTIKREQEQCIAGLMIEVARALDFAHQRGVLHRDLKPSNILIDVQGQPHLSDFGLAKLTSREASGITLSSAVLGTPGYLAPEQAAGRTDQVTTAADVYGLGATLYELLTGRPPFAGASALETMWMAINDAPTPPRAINPAIHRDLETIVLRCLEKEPEQRYHTAAEVADELERFVRHEPIHARPVGMWEHAWRWQQRNPWLAGMAAALLLVIVLGSSAALSQWIRAERSNAVLSENLSHLEWADIDATLAQGEASRALAKLAFMLRGDPQNSQPAAFAISLLKQHPFPLPVASPIQHPEGEELTVARLSPDGSRIATASFDGTLRLWDAATSEPAGPPLQHTAPVLWAAFRPDSQVLATCCEDREVQLWNLADGTRIGRPYRHAEKVVQVQFSPDGRNLLAQSARQVVVLDGTDGRVQIGPLQFEGTIVSSAIVAGSSAFFAAEQAGEQSHVRLWSLVTGEEQASLATGPLRDAALSEDLSRVAVLAGGTQGWIADFPSGENRVAIVSTGGPLMHVAFGEEGNALVTIGQNHWARVWDAQTGRPLTSELPHYFLLNGATLFDADRRLLSWGNDALAQVWDLETNSRFCEPMRHSHRVVHAEAGHLGGQQVFLTTLSHLKSRSSETRTGAAQLWALHDRSNGPDLHLGFDANYHDGMRLSPDGCLIALGKTTGEAWVFNRHDGSVVCGPLRVKGGAWGVHFSLDNTQLITTSSRGQIARWSIPEGTLLGEPMELPTTFQPTEMSADGKHLATGSTDHRVRLWDASTLNLVWQQDHGDELNALDFSPDGRLLASAGEDRLVKLWSTTDGELQGELRGHGNEVMAVFFSPDGRRLLTASLDFTARIWDVATGQELLVLPHQGEVLDAAWHPDGRSVATCSRDRTAVIWDAETGMPRVRSLLHQQGVRNVRFSPDGRKLATLDFRSLRIWDAASGHPLTVPLPQEMMGGTGFQTSSTRLTFTPDSQAVMVGADSAQAKLWELETPPPGVPAWFPELLEAIARQRFANPVRPESVSAEAFLEIRTRLLLSAESDAYSRWARRWLVAGAH